MVQGMWKKQMWVVTGAKGDYLKEWQASLRGRDQEFDEGMIVFSKPERARIQNIFEAD